MIGILNGIITQDFEKWFETFTLKITKNYVMKSPLTKQIVMALFVLINTSSCITESKVDCDDYYSPPTYYNISEKSKSLISFLGKDTLTYVSTNGDTAILIGKDKYKYYEYYIETTGIYPECKGPEHYYENIRNSFKADIKHSLNMLEYKIYIPVGYYSNGNYFAAIDIKVNDYLLFDGYILAGISDSLDFNDSVSINGKLYYGLTLFGDGQDSLPSLLYNPMYGILKVKFNSNEIWLKQ